MFHIIRTIDFCYGHRLFNYEGKCRHLHGHNGRVEITLASEVTDRRGMVLDFTDIKRMAGQWIEDNLDHRMILYQLDPAVPVLQQLGEPLYLLDVNPTAENLAKLIFEKSQSFGFPVLEVKMWETPRCCAVYRSGSA